MILKNKKVIIFDFDGTLVDTMPIFADVAGALMAEHCGIEKKFARQKYLETSGLPFCKQIEIIAPGHKANSDVVKQFEYDKLIATSGVKVTEEDKNAFYVLQNKGYFLAISSNNYQHNIDDFVKNNRFEKIFNPALGFKDDFGKGAPHFSHIMQVLDLKPEEVAFVGDSLNDGRLAGEFELDFIGKVGTFDKKAFMSLNGNIYCIEKISDLLKIVD